MAEVTTGNIITDWRRLVELRERWRKEGSKVVFTNGVFDLLHRGHLDYLQTAKSTGDYLVVGVNTDASVKRLKGDRRPVIGEGNRAFALACLRFVDAVTLFDQDTPLELIRTLKPDILVKGADYREDQIVGAEDVRSWGGEVLRIPLTEGESSTNLIERILRAYR
jgi:D-beta-D-heptose 7-phosphate kinase/D-beta-D-heptose 1-phosphate adenosyltransferase